jgi:hypothetical protein
MEGAIDIGLDEVLRAMNGTIDMGFGGKIDDGARLILPQPLQHTCCIADVTMDEKMALVTLQALQVGQVARISQFIHIDDWLIACCQPVKDKIAADETGAAGD